MIYLDYQATTPLAPEAAAAMRPWLEEKFANPHSPHKLGPRGGGGGRGGAGAGAGARSAAAGKLHFTSGATEAANWALKGSGAAAAIVTLATEHACVLDTRRMAGGAGA